MCKRWLFATLIFSLAAGSAAAQDRQSKQYAVTTDRAVDVTRDVLSAQGFEIIEVREQDDGDRVVLYRAAIPRGRLERLVIRRVDNRIVFVDAPTGLLADIDHRLRL